MTEQDVVITVTKEEADELMVALRSYARTLADRGQYGAHERQVVEGLRARVRTASARVPRRCSYCGVQLPSYLVRTLRHPEPKCPGLLASLSGS